MNGPTLEAQSGKVGWFTTFIVELSKHERAKVVSFCGIGLCSEIMAPAAAFLVDGWARGLPVFLGMACFCAACIAEMLIPRRETVGRRFREAQDTRADDISWRRHQLLYGGSVHPRIEVSNYRGHWRRRR